MKCIEKWEKNSFFLLLKRWHINCKNLVQLLHKVKLITSSDDKKMLRDEAFEIKPNK